MTVEESHAFLLQEETEKLLMRTAQKGNTDDVI